VHRVENLGLAGVTDVGDDLWVALLARPILSQLLDDSFTIRTSWSRETVHGCAGSPTFWLPKWGSSLTRSSKHRGSLFHAGDREPRRPSPVARGRIAGEERRSQVQLALEAVTEGEHRLDVDRHVALGGEAVGAGALDPRVDDLLEPFGADDLGFPRMVSAEELRHPTTEALEREPPEGFHLAPGEPHRPS
jgi:hypothetical protein